MSCFPSSPIYLVKNLRSTALSTTRSWIKLSGIRTRRVLVNSGEKGGGTMTEKIQIKRLKKFLKSLTFKNLSFTCDHCDARFKSEDGLKIHVGKAHKSEVISVPEKERGVSHQNKLLQTLTPGKERREEVKHEPNISKIVCTKCWESWGPQTSCCNRATS